jgi:hypothetical protein
MATGVFSAKSVTQGSHMEGLFRQLENYGLVAAPSSGGAVNYLSLTLKKLVLGKLFIDLLLKHLFERFIFILLIFYSCLIHFIF